LIFTFSRELIPRVRKCNDNTWHVIVTPTIVCGYSSGTVASGGMESGVMGYVTRDQALVCLQNCPLLADLAVWSHWDIVFRPALRDLKDFICKHGGVYQCTTFSEISTCRLVSVM